MKNNYTGAIMNYPEYVGRVYEDNKDLQAVIRAYASAIVPYSVAHCVSMIREHITEAAKRAAALQALPTIDAYRDGQKAADERAEYLREHEAKEQLIKAQAAAKLEAAKKNYFDEYNRQIMPNAEFLSSDAAKILNSGLIQTPAELEEYAIKYANDESARRMIENYAKNADGWEMADRMRFTNITNAKNVREFGDNFFHHAAAAIETPDGYSAMLISDNSALNTFAINNGVDPDKAYYVNSLIIGQTGHVMTRE